MPSVRSGHLNTHCQEGSPRGLRGAAQAQKVKVGAGPGCSREAPAAGGGGAPGGARHVGLGRPIRAETRPEELVSVNEGCHSGCSRPNAECRGLCASCGLRCRRRGRTSLAGGSWAPGLWVQSLSAAAPHSTGGKEHLQFGVVSRAAQEGSGPQFPRVCLLGRELPRTLPAPKQKCKVKWQGVRSLWAPPCYSGRPATCPGVTPGTREPLQPRAGRGRRRPFYFLQYFKSL